MSLLQDIQASAIDADVPLSQLLRHCLVLATRLGNAEFKAWVHAELDGYQSADEVPPYRTFQAISKGNFVGPFQSQARNVNIPMACLPERARDHFALVRLREPVSALEALVDRAEDGVLSEAWPPDFVALVGREIYENMNCIGAWKVIPAAAVVGALDSVRNRILSFALEIEAEAPDVGKTIARGRPIPDERVQQVFHSNFYAEVGNVATGSKDVHQEAVIQKADLGVFDRLLDALPTANAPEETIDALADLVREMRANADDPPKFSTAYKGFMATLNDHVTVLGPVVMQYLPALAAFLPR